MDNTAKQIALLKLRDALELLSEKGMCADVVFAPDIIRDVGLSEVEGKDLVLELSGVEKDRLSGFKTFMRGGGHALLGANAAMALRGNEKSANVAILAKILPKDRHELVQQYLIDNPKERGVESANASFVIDDSSKPKGMAVNVVLARKSSTTILLGAQPKLSIDDYSAEARAQVMQLLQSADIIAVLSLKSQFMAELLDLIAKGELQTKDLFCDSTSGTDMNVNYTMLDIMRKKDTEGKSSIGLLSLNENEVLLFEMLLRRENERERIISVGKEKANLVAELDAVLREEDDKDRVASVKRQLDETESFVFSGRMENAFEAGRMLYEKTGVPLLLHTKDGSCIIGGDKATSFIPSVEIRFPKGSSFVGAGDTLCGAMAMALAVKKKTDGLLPEAQRLTYSDCLVIANIATGYRLAKVNRIGCEKGADALEWYEAVGTINDLYTWASAVPFRSSTAKPLPNGIAFVDVEGNSKPLSELSSMDGTKLVKLIRDCSTISEKYGTARVAFEVLRTREQPEADALTELVKDECAAGILFGHEAIKLLFGAGKIGSDKLMAISDSTSNTIAKRMLLVLRNYEDKRAAEITFNLLLDISHRSLVLSLEDMLVNANQKFRKNLYSLAHDKTLDIPGPDIETVIQGLLKDLKMSEAKAKKFGDVIEHLHEAAEVHLGARKYGVEDGWWLTEQSQVAKTTRQLMKSLDIPADVFEKIVLVSLGKAVPINGVCESGPPEYFFDFLIPPVSSNVKTFLMAYIKFAWEEPRFHSPLAGSPHFETFPLHAMQALSRCFPDDNDAQALTNTLFVKCNVCRVLMIKEIEDCTREVEKNRSVSASSIHERILVEIARNNLSNACNLVDAYTKNSEHIRQILEAWPTKRRNSKLQRDAQEGVSLAPKIKPPRNDGQTGTGETDKCRSTRPIRG